MFLTVRYHSTGMTSTNVRGTRLFYETLAPPDMEYIPNDYVTVFERDGFGKWSEQACGMWG